MNIARSALQQSKARQPDDRSGMAMPSAPPAPAPPPRAVPAQTERAKPAQRVTADTVPAKRYGGKLATLLFASTMLLLVYTGWHNRAESYLTAESGVGYALGIIGGSLMLLLLLYPLRKRVAFMRHLGPVKFWFRFHMLLGIIGPICILYHANFRLGAVNSNVALICMLIVAASGLIGRYLYRNIHHGLYGRKATLKELADDEIRLKDRLDAALESMPALRHRLQKLRAWEPRPERGVFHELIRIMGFGLWTHWAHLALRLKVSRVLAVQGRARGWSARETKLKRREAGRYLNDFFTAVRRVARFSVFERLFSLWHLLHMPLFIMMAVTGVIHVIAVHMY